MFNIIILWISALITMIAIDIVWIGTMVSRLYAPNIGHLMAKTPNFYPAGVFYALYISALIYFVLYPAQTLGWSTSKILLSGALFGLVTYGTFDLTNHAILKDWSLTVTVADMVWGATLTAVVCVVSLKVASWF